MPAPSAQSSLLDVEFRGDTGRWVRLRGEPGTVEFTTGRTGNRLDPSRSVPLSRIELRGGRDGVALRARWPVPEVLTNRTVEVFDDLHGELREAGDPTPGTTIDRAVGLLGTDVGDDTEPAARVLATAYPLLRAPLAAGARPHRVPVAVEHVVAHSNPRDAARATLRPRATTRPLVRALATALMPDANGVIAWERILLALMAAARCGPEQLTEILSSPVHHPGAVSFSVVEIQRARWMFADRHPRRITAGLCAALDQAGGTAELAKEIAAFGTRRAPVPDPTPPDQEPPRRGAAPQLPVGQRPIDHPLSVRSIEGLMVDGLRVVLPTTGDELLEWGAAMGNCLGAYRGPTGRGLTHIIGFVLDPGLFPGAPQLEVVAEVSRAKVLRQLEEPGNTRPSRRRSQVIVSFLREHRVVEADGRQA